MKVVNHPDAPIQGCQFNQIVTPEWAERIKSADAGIPVESIDFRRTILDETIPECRVHEYVHSIGSNCPNVLRCLF